MVTGGGWDAGGDWRPIFGWDRPVLRELFEVEVFRFLREKELLNAERMQLIRSWRHSGFGVHVGEAIGPGERQALEHVARYLLRAPVSLERLWYNPEAGTVTIRPLAYSNASALQRKHRQAREGQGEASPWALPAEDPTPFERRCRIRWAQLIFYQNPLQNTPRLAAGMNACLAEGVIRGSGASPLSTIGP